MPELQHELLFDNELLLFEHKARKNSSKNISKYTFERRFIFLWQRKIKIY